MTREDAEARYPGAEPVPSTCEIRNLPEMSDEEHSAGAPRES